MKRIKIWVLLFISLVGVVGIISGIYYQNYLSNLNEERKEIKKIESRLAEQEKMNATYQQYVIVNKDSSLYDYDESSKEYIEAGKIKEGITLELDTLDLESTYFKIKDTSYYIPYQDVDKTENSLDTRYQSYIPFYQVSFNGEYSFLDQEGNQVLTMYLNDTLPIYEQIGELYGVELFSQIFYIGKDISFTLNEVEEEKASSIPVLNYHFIYLNGDDSCQESICHSEEQIKEHFSYLHDNHVLTITTEELGRFIDGEINLPRKTVLITIDDGARAENFIPFLEQYDLKATLFLVSSWYPTSMFQSSNLELASHTHNLHTVGVCEGGQGSGIRCLPEEEIQADLKASRETLNNTKAFCYPFYEYNDYAKEQVKKAGFELGFIGGSTKVTRNTDKYLIPRYPIQATTNVNFIKKLIEN